MLNQAAQEMSMPPRSDRPPISLIHWIAMPILSLVTCEIALYFMHSLDAQKDMLSGWGLGVIFHVVGIVIFHRAVGSELDRFILLALGGIITRLFVLIIFIVIVLVGGFLQSGPFLIGLLTAYFTGSWMEIVLMAKLKPSPSYSTISGFVTNGSSGTKHEPNR